ncbi:TonB-dependent receptor [Hydrocarboniphaga sp.]|uniref:TonB-dependent receptor n=1 Tax=Hydrocarboniphaga sp. TaxID=2033016 RepID=UPI002636505F|nr:TonB-dependent receptor [Hydrocarboniphaga sp.]
MSKSGRSLRLNNWAVAIACLSFTGSAFAQIAAPKTDTAPAPDAAPGQTAASGAGVIDEVVVTARKTRENIQDVPVAITALGGDALAEASIFDVQDIQTHTPNIYIRTAPGQGQAIAIQIRGQVQNDTVATLDPSVGFYQDGIYIARPFGSNVSFVDVQSVQVLRGPQGTLFGRNTTGGAILLTSNDPVLNSYSGSLATGVSSFDGVKSEAVVNIPLINDKLALRVAGQRVTNDGYAFDATNQRGTGSEHHTLLRAKLLFKATDELSFLASGEYIDLDQINVGSDLAFASPLRFADFNGDGVPDDFNGDGRPDPVDGVARGFVLGASGGTDTIDNYIGRPYTSNNNAGFRPTSTLQVKSLGLTTTLEQEWATIKLIAGYRENGNIFNAIDFDSTPYPILDTTLDGYGRQSSVELQFTGTAFEHLKWAAGGYYFSEGSYEHSISTAFGGAAVTVFDGNVDGDSAGAYAQGSYSVTEQLTATAGLRYSSDKKKLESHNVANGVCVVPGVAAGEECSGKFSDTFNKTNYLIGTDYKITEGVLAYGSLTTGYRAGGENLRANSVASFQPFDPEEVTQYELGLKSDLLGRRLRANAAVFYSNYDNIQRSVIVTAADGTNATMVVNAAKAEVKGGELELTALPIDSLELTASLGITRPKYKRYVDAQGVDRSHEPFDLVPKMTYMLAGTHTAEFNGFKWRNSLDWSWQDKVISSSANIRSFAAEDQAAVEDALTQKAVGVLGARSSLDFDNGLGVSLWGKNLSDEHRYAAQLGFGAPVGIVVRYPEVGREVGMDVSYRF